jgi:putative transposase
MNALVDTFGYPMGEACKLMELPRSMDYYRSQAVDESELETAIKEVAGRFVRYGSRRITHQLRREPAKWQLNRKRIQRMMRNLGLLQVVKRWKCRTTNSENPYRRYSNLVKDLEITFADQVWVSDITYIRLGQGFIYLAVIMEVFTWAIRGWNLSKSLDQELTLAALRMALVVHCPTIHHSDQGVQYAANVYVEMLNKHGS